MQRSPRVQAGEPPHWQAPATQVSDLAPSQAAHTAPFAPHAASVAGETHPPGEQQPAQVAGSQTQLPPTQRSLAPQAGPAPH